MTSSEVFFGASHAKKVPKRLRINIIFFARLDEGHGATSFLNPCGPL